MATMPRRPGQAWTPIFLAAVFLAGVRTAAAEAPVATKMKRVLVLDKSALGPSGHLESRRDFNSALASLAAGKGFAVTTLGQDASISRIGVELSAANLSSYQVVIFDNNDGVDGIVDSGARANIEAYVKGGGGLIAVHDASAFIFNWPWLTHVLVQSFWGPSGIERPAANLAHDPDGLKDGTAAKGIFKGLTAPLAFVDEYFSFRHSPRDSAGVTILVTVDEKSYSKPINSPMGEDHPLVWAKDEGKGRVINMSMGHSWSDYNVYAARNGYLTNLLYGELRYAAGDFIGCTDEAYAEYDPDATKSDPAACRVPVGIRISGNGAGYRVASVSRSGSHIRIEFLSPSPHEATLLDMSGKVVNRRTGTGPARYDIAVPAQAGMYVVKARSQGRTRIQRITVL